MMTTTNKMLNSCANTTPCDLPCDLPCQKCGSTDIYRRYYKEGQDTNPGSSPNKGDKTTEFVNRKDDWVQPALTECLIHHCRCCGYRWDDSILVTEDLR